MAAMAFLALRGWWYAKGFGKSERMPRDVREFMIKRYTLPAFAALKTDEEKEQFAAQIISKLLQMGPDEISEELRAEMFKLSFEFIAQQNLFQNRRRNQAVLDQINKHLRASIGLAIRRFVMFIFQLWRQGFRQVQNFVMALPGISHFKARGMHCYRQHLSKLGDSEGGIFLFEVSGIIFTNMEIFSLNCFDGMILRIFFSQPRDPPKQTLLLHAQFPEPLCQLKTANLVFQLHIEIKHLSIVYCK